MLPFALAFSELAQIHYHGYVPPLIRFFAMPSSGLGDHVMKVCFLLPQQKPHTPLEQPPRFSPMHESSSIVVWQEAVPITLASQFSFRHPCLSHPP
jgi:hypothetical protein